MYKRNCKPCQLVRGNPKLKERVYHAFYSRDPGDETITQIAIELEVSRTSLRNHCIRHTKIKSVALEEVQTTKVIEKIKAKIQKDTELSFDHEDIVPKQDFELVIDGVLADGYDQLKKQNKNISISQLLTAAKIKADYTSKKRGQDTELIKTMYRMASGADKTDSTRTVAEVDSGGSDGPSDIHKQAARYAFTPGTDTVLTGDTEA